MYEPDMGVTLVPECEAVYLFPVPGDTGPGPGPGPDGRGGTAGQVAMTVMSTPFVERVGPLQ